MMTTDPWEQTLVTMASSADDRSQYQIIFPGESHLLASASSDLTFSLGSGNTVLTGTILDRAASVACSTSGLIPHLSDKRSK